MFSSGSPFTATRSASLPGSSVPASAEIPKSSAVMTVAERMKLNGRPWAYVGDTMVDKTTAAAAGIPFYAVPWGGGRHIDVEPSRRLTRLRDLDDTNDGGRED